MCNDSRGPGASRDRLTPAAIAEPGSCAQVAKAWPVLIAVVAAGVLSVLLLFYGVIQRLYLIASCRDNLVGLSC
jgi:hypothetical protein